MSATGWDGRIPNGVVAMCFYGFLNFLVTTIFTQILHRRKKIEWKPVTREREGGSSLFSQSLSLSLTRSLSYFPVVISDPDNVSKWICRSGLCISIVGVLLNLALIIVFVSITGRFAWTVLYYIGLLLFNCSFFYYWFQLYSGRQEMDDHGNETNILFQALLDE